MEELILSVSVVISKVNRKLASKSDVVCHSGACLATARVIFAEESSSRVIG